MRAGLFILGAALALTPALAKEKDNDLSVAETRKLLADYGLCVVKKQAARASEAILKNVDNRVLIDDYGRLIDGSCLPVRRGDTLMVRFKGDQYRYSLADALVSQEYASQAAPALESLPPLDHRDPGTPPWQFDKKGKPLSAKKIADNLASYEQAKTFTFLSRYGECVVRADPAAARALLLAKPETAEENARFAALSEPLGLCMPVGHTLGFGKLVLRGTIAINYYRLAKAAGVPAAGGTK